MHCHAPGHEGRVFLQDGPDRRGHLDPALRQRAESDIHFHMLFLDGVYVERTEGSARFLRVKAPTSAEVTSDEKGVYFGYTPMPRWTFVKLRACESG
jgi:hypothetical protein